VTKTEARLYAIGLGELMGHRFTRKACTHQACTLCKADLHWLRVAGNDTGTFAHEPTAPFGRALEEPCSHRVRVRLAMAKIIWAWAGHMDPFDQVQRFGREGKPAPREFLEGIHAQLVERLARPQSSRARKELHEMQAFVRAELSLGEPP
jgi:hypothetical protein